MKRIIIGITGASGSIYARQTIEMLLASGQVSEVAVVISPTAKAVMEFEGIRLPDDMRLHTVADDDMFCPLTSGSSPYDAMAVVPCSMGSLARIAAGYANDVIARAADVMLKERRPLVVCPRETPYNLIHLRNMATITEAGGIVLPASPSFYSRPTTIEEACRTVTERIATHLGIESKHFEWQGR